jgi:hypothetical protein
MEEGAGLDLVDRREDYRHGLWVDRLHYSIGFRVRQAKN